MDSKLTILILLVCIGSSLASSVCFCDNFDADSPYSCIMFGDCCNYCKQGVSCGCDDYCKISGDCCSYCEIEGRNQGVEAYMIVDNNRE
ncbi:hypothetical protein HOLleu_27656 [Holothuria leucospilota]|uniref:Uncharacterized protein n=1 Tax=Holothuria leucospilota TaxID=206669 RepID=A0A9Q1BR18_HOLLE|nr:hypothetical protein HOLleu_27656 [Holothuria leucospilota]